MLIYFIVIYLSVAVILGTFLYINREQIQSDWKNLYNDSKQETYFVGYVIVVCWPILLGMCLWYYYFKK